MKLDALCQQVQLVLSDVDGVLTDGGILYDNRGIELKRFHVRDGVGIRLWQRAGFTFGVITSRTSQAVKLRCSELDIGQLRQGVTDKLSVAQEIAESLDLTSQQICFIGDDLPDLAVIRWAGLGVAVANACGEVKEAAAHVTSASGGQGAVRELLEMLLKAQQRWDDLIRRYAP